MIDFENNNDSNHDFELVMCVRDSQGNLTDKKKSFSTDSPAKLSQFYFRMAGVRKKKPKKDLGALPSSKDVKTVMKDVYKEEDKTTE